MISYRTECMSIFREIVKKNNLPEQLLRSKFSKIEDEQSPFFDAVYQALKVNALIEKKIDSARALKTYCKEHGSKSMQGIFDLEHFEKEDMKKLFKEISFLFKVSIQTFMIQDEENFETLKFGQRKDSKLIFVLYRNNQEIFSVFS